MGVGMTKAFGALGGVMVDEDAVMNKNYESAMHAEALQATTEKIGISRAAKRMQFMNRMKSNSKM